MLHREIIAVCSEIRTKHINTLCGQNVEFVNIKPGGIYSDHCKFTSTQSAAESARTQEKNTNRLKGRQRACKRISVQDLM
jgi:hypothetical protein